MKLIALVGLPTKEKGWLARDLAAHYLGAGRSVAVLDNAGIMGDVADATSVTTVRGSIGAGDLRLAGNTEVLILAADSQTHIGDLTATLDEFADESSYPVELQIVALVDERTTCCFPYVAELLTDYADITLHAPFSAQDILK